MSRWKIALLAHIRHPIAPPFKGGMEAHTSLLADALVRRGHDVTLFASGDSVTGARLRPVLPRHYDADLPWHQFHGTEALNRLQDDVFESVLDDLADGGFDVIHNNSLHRYPPRMARRDGVPMLTAMHVPSFKILAKSVRSAVAPWALQTYCSEVHRRSWWPDRTPAETRIVANGIPLDDWTFVPNGDGTAVWAGRITPNKGTHIAVEAARILGIELTIYGVIEHEDYFRDRIEPHLGPSVRYGGHLPQDALASAIGRASVLLFTPLWDEPFGLVAAEAMACGVPVAALPHGAVREVVGRGGCVAQDDNGEALATAARTALTLSRRDVRRYAEDAFALDRMVTQYEALYGEAMTARPTRVPPVHYAPIELPPRVAQPLEAIA